MTREEAIEFGNMWLQINEDCKDSNTYAFFQMAIKTLEQEPCDDAISRQAVIDEIFGSRKNFNNEFDQGFFVDKIRDLPPVKPQEPKTGHWIDIMVGDMPAQACDRCNTFYPLAYTGGGHKHCPNCGVKMIEPHESEE